VRCHRGPVADLGSLAPADQAGLLAILQSDIPRQDIAAGIVRLHYSEAQPVTVAPATVMAFGRQSLALAAWSSQFPLISRDQLVRSSPV
jgi:hypothetical protein